MKKMSRSNFAIFLFVILASIFLPIPAMINPTDPAELKLCQDAIVVPCLEAINTGKPPSSTCCTNLHNHWTSCYCILNQVPDGRSTFSTSDAAVVLETCGVPTHLHCLMRTQVAN
ncbi:hypothetical protein ACH5RR_019500 [Cinchona calisaya]|uniref:Bifunctional inhibitor/plant lipid transfer protein/seed storage helical domain-containing protein n=1 Tax=Cinchona calisaya TaxID=153742 RepID=A0ABD2ZR93_9GENT